MTIQQVNGYYQVKTADGNTYQVRDEETAKKLEQAQTGKELQGILRGAKDTLHSINGQEMDYGNGALAIEHEPKVAEVASKPVSEEPDAQSAPDECTVNFTRDGQSYSLKLPNKQIADKFREICPDGQEFTPEMEENFHTSKLVDTPNGTIDVQQRFKFDLNKATIAEGPEKYGNRASKYGDVGGYEFSVPLTSTPLVQPDGKIDEKNQQKYYDELKNEFAKQASEQEAAIERNTKLNVDEEAMIEASMQGKSKAEIDAAKEASRRIKVDDAKKEAIADYAIRTSGGPALTQMRKAIADEPDRQQIAEYDNYVIKKDPAAQRNVALRASQTEKEMNAAFEKLKNGQTLTKDEEKLLEDLKHGYNRLYAAKDGDQRGEFAERINISTLYAKRTPEQQKDIEDKFKATAHLMAVEEEIYQKDANGGQKLSEDQISKLAEAKLKEGMLRTNELEELTTKLRYAEQKGLKTEAANLKEQIKAVEESREKSLEKIKNGMIEERANTQVRMETYKQQYDNTIVHWDKDDAKDNAVEGKNNTHLNKYARKLIQNNEEFRNRVCDEAAAGQGDFEVDGKAYKLNSKKFQEAMLHEASLNNEFEHEEGADYFASTGDWAKFANEHAKKKSGVATMGERSDVREMFDAAGIEVSKDRTYAMRAGNIGKAALIGAGAGAVGTALGKLGQALQSNIKYNGSVAHTIKGVVEGVVTGTVNGTVTQHVSTAVNGSQTVTVEGDVNYSGEVGYSGEVPYNYSGTATGTTTQESIVTRYDAKTGQYITVGHQTQEIPVDVPYNGSGTASYSGTAGYSGTAHYTQDVTVNYSEPVELDVTQEYSQDYEAKYSKEYEKTEDVDYAGDVNPRPSFEEAVKDVAKGAGIGAAVGAATRGLGYIFKKKKHSDYVNTDNAKETSRGDSGFKTQSMRTVDNSSVKMEETAAYKVQDTGKDIPNLDHKMKVRRGQGTMLYRGQQVPYNEAEDKKNYVQQLYNVPADKLDAVYKYIMEEINGLKPNQYNDTQYVNNLTYHFPAELPKEITGLDADYKQEMDPNSVPKKWIKIPLGGRGANLRGGENRLNGKGEEAVDANSGTYRGTRQQAEDDYKKYKKE